MTTKSFLEWLGLIAIFPMLLVLLTAWGITAVSMFIVDCLEDLKDWKDKPIVGI